MAECILVCILQVSILLTFVHCNLVHPLNLVPQVTMLPSIVYVQERYHYFGRLLTALLHTGHLAALGHWSCLQYSNTHCAQNLCPQLVSTGPSKVPRQTGQLSCVPLRAAGGSLDSTPMSLLVL